ncbi:Long chain acyl-CoA synthetase 7, peroxisomal [Smittium culicis]|uniref:Long chain acyl-CoA synthetase 7, peroxisomal n=1 Tax=Smittium culicis TaxID=133412 RepID=A0A1R1XCC7_9FUNG|nr:Long chain acyl-CoA synthetase 7, peroxisomal [Smittium culicis]OMJ16202.1 Long chain acyl-CoA synthetase 7, peroxisomal [Smittium culicis]
MKSYAIPNTAKPGESHVLRHNSCKDSLELTIFPEVRTAHDMFWNSVKIASDKPFLGHRKYNSATKTYGEYVYQTYGQVATRVTNLGCGLVYINQQVQEQPNGGIKRNFPVAIYANNCPEWAITERAAFTQSLYTVSLYDTLGESSVEYIINHSEAPLIVCSIDKVAKLLRMSDDIPNIRNIVCTNSFDQVAEGSGSHMPSPYNTSAVSVLKQWAASKNINLYDINQVERIGAEHSIPHYPPKPDDIYTICYTSGTTGNPKGALCTHSAYTFAAKSSVETSEISSHPVYISYLPLAHTYGRTCENITTLLQGTIGYFRGDITGIIEDCQALQPTMFASVPRLLNRIYDRMAAATIYASGITGIIARKAVSDKLANLKAGLGIKHAVWDRLLFNKMKAIISKRLIRVNTGSAPLEANVLDFLRIGLACTVVEGFGMTETSAMSTIQCNSENTSGNIGVPAIGVECKLIDVKEMNYLVTDSPVPRGELCVRGANLFVGYLKEEEKTRESFVGDGWFATGDISQFNADGTISIIDRKKNIFKLSQGEYVAPEKIENILSKHQLVMQSFVHGDSLNDKLVAVIVPDPETFVPWAKKVLAKSPAAHASTLSELCSNSEVIAAFQAQVDEATTRAKLQGFEKPKAIFLESTPFDIEVNQLLTPTLKLKRKEAAVYYKDTIAALYAKLKNAN